MLEAPEKDGAGLALEGCAVAEHRRAGGRSTSVPVTGGRAGGGEGPAFPSPGTDEARIGAGGAPAFPVTGVGRGERLPARILAAPSLCHLLPTGDDGSG